jgi:putative glutathione S-transferase
MLDQEFEAESKSKLDFFPAGIEAEHKELSAYIYHNINNGVYMAGFSTSQRAYEKNCRNVFAALDQIEKRLAKSRFLFGKQPVEADWRLFCTLVRFDPVYYLHFKCNIRRILDYPNLQGYLLDLYQFPGIADTVDFDHIKRHYYMTHDEINPTRLVPIGPEMNLLRPHGRERLES